MNKNHSYGSEEVEHEWVSLGLLHPTYRSCIFYHSIYHDQLGAPPCMAGQVSAIFADAEGLCYLLLGLLRRHLEKKQTCSENFGLQEAVGKLQGGPP